MMVSWNCTNKLNAFNNIESRDYIHSAIDKMEGDEDFKKSVFSYNVFIKNSIAFQVFPEDSSFPRHRSEENGYLILLYSNAFNGRELKEIRNFLKTKCELELIEKKLFYSGTKLFHGMSYKIYPQNDVNLLKGISSKLIKVLNPLNENKISFSYFFDDEKAL